MYFKTPCRLSSTGEIDALNSSRPPLAKFTGGSNDWGAFEKGPLEPVSANGLLSYYPFEGNGFDRSPTANHGNYTKVSSKKCGFLLF